MARYSAEFTTSAGSSTLPIGSVYAVAANGFILREAGVFNTVATAPTVGMKLVRLTSTGTQGAAITETLFDPNLAPNACQAFNTHSVAPTLGTDIASMGVGAAIGSGTILTFYGEGGGIRVTSGTANGVGILPLGVGQVCTVYFVWDE